MCMKYIEINTYKLCIEFNKLAQKESFNKWFNLNSGRIVLLRKKGMDEEKIANQESLPVNKIGLISFKFSNIGIFEWDRPLSMVKKILENHEFKTYLYVKVFGMDELWAITSLQSSKEFEKIEKEPIIAYTASLENALPLDLLAIDKIEKSQLPVGYVFFRKKDTGIKLQQIKKLLKKNSVPFLIGEINHPEGYSHFAAYTIENKSLQDLGRVAHELMGSLECLRWKAFLGVEHVWEGAGEKLKNKMQIAKELRLQISRWLRAIP